MPVLKFTFTEYNENKRGQNDRSSSCRIGFVWYLESTNSFGSESNFNSGGTCMKHQCESCEDKGYLEVTNENSIEENQWCQNCWVIFPDYAPPKIEEFNSLIDENERTEFNMLNGETWRN